MCYCNLIACPECRQLLVVDEHTEASKPGEKPRTWHRKEVKKNGDMGVRRNATPTR